jgi:hypothetical protein
MTDCPLCGLAGTEAETAKHMLTHHSVLVDQPVNRMLVCLWCGTVVSTRITYMINRYAVLECWAKHVAAHGGVQAHYAATHLGINQ